MKYKVVHVLILIGAIALLASCGTSKRTGGEVFSKECVLPDDQANSLQGKWEKPPIKIAYHKADWAESEKGEITAAAETWNTFMEASKGTEIFSVSTEESPMNQTNPSCAGSTVADGTVIYKRFANWTRSKSAVAVTTFCTTVTSNGGLPKMYNAIMEFNAVDFGPNAGKIPDIQSIALHELGHLIGLDHSCGSLRSGKPNLECPDSNSGNWVVDTAMFPAVFFDTDGIGEIKQSLQLNDQQRANCLY